MVLRRGGILPHNYAASERRRLLLGFPRGFLPQGFSTKILYAFLTSLMHVACSAHLVMFDLIALMMKNANFEVTQFLLLPVTFCLLGLNILLSALF